MKQPIFISNSGKSSEMSRVLNQRCCKALSPKIIAINIEQIPRPTQSKLNEVNYSNELLVGNAKAQCSNADIYAPRVNQSKLHHLEYRMIEGQDELSQILSTKNKDSLNVSNQKSQSSTVQKINIQTVEFDSCSPKSVLSKDQLDLNNFNIVTAQNY